MSSQEQEMTPEQLLDRWSRSTAEHGLDEPGEVVVTRKEQWYILDGWVTDSRAKTLLIEQVPRSEGAQWIVDRIRIGRPARAGERPITVVRRSPARPGDQGAPL